ncbi:MAG: hypothetical protein ABJA79_10545, partial [Parafilimonas sp.]
LEKKLSGLTPEQQEQLIKFIDEITSAKNNSQNKPHLTFNWAGGLAHLKDEYTSGRIAEKSYGMDDRRYLIDTNIFVEILLNQQKSALCASYLAMHQHESVISDFSLHSIAIICTTKSLHNAFSKFLADILPVLAVIYIEPQNLSLVID